VRVRKAVNMAIDRDAIIEAVYLGAGVKAKNPIPPTIWSYNDAVVDYDYDPAAAQALLDEAGVHDLHVTLWAMPVQRPYNPNAARMAELMQADLAKVGITAEIVTYEWGEYLERSSKGEHDMVLLVQRGLRGADYPGQADQRRRCSHGPLRTGPGRVQGPGALGDDCPFGRLHADDQQCAELQDRPVRRPYLLRRRPGRISGSRGRSDTGGRQLGPAARCVCLSTIEQRHTFRPKRTAIPHEGDLL